MIAFDIDGVVADIFSPLRKAVLRDFDYDLCGNSPIYDLRIPTLRKGHTTRYVVDFLNSNCLNIPAVDGCAECVQTVHRISGKPVLFVTARWPSIYEPTVSWLSNELHGVPFHVVLKSSKEKALFLHSIGYSALVEDRYRTATQASELLDTVYLVDQEWNRGRPLPENVCRVSDLKDLSQKLKEKWL